ncbi:MAG: aminotransferase class IV [Myxococcales bacterium]
MSSLVLIDGRPSPPEAATISVFDRGFLYGDSVFEALRTYGGRPFALERHLQRLAESAARVFIDLPVSLQQLGREVHSAIVGAGNPESYVRLTVTRGVGETLGLDPGLARHPLRVVIVTPLKSPPEETYRDGVAVITYRTERVTDHSVAAGAKVGNYLTAVLAIRQARAVGAAEALIVDGRGSVVEGATSNVFAVLGDGTLVTPPESDGILLGITREAVLAVAAELGVPIQQQSLPLEVVKNAAEVFVSSSIRELVPVVSVDGAAIGPGKPGPTTTRLLTAFRDACRRSTTP